MQGSAIIHTDGGSRGNPGPGAGAYVITDEKGNLIEGRGVFLGDVTNNIAEYTGLVEGLKAGKKLGLARISIFSDSQLMVRQINGQYKVKSENLKDLYSECMGLLGGFEGWRISHVLRESNKDSDALANEAMDAGHDVKLESKQKKKSFKTKPIRLGIMLSGGGTTMVNIQTEIDAGRLNAEIAVVISSRTEVKGVERARDIGVEPVIIRKKDFATIDTFSDAIAQALDEAKVDLVVQAGWLCLWQIPGQYKNRVMNIHPALLPSFGGQGMWGHHVHEAVLKHGCKVSGCTVHFADNEYDKGPIIVQKGCAVKEDDTPDTLAARVFEQECIAYPLAIKLFSEGRINIQDGIVKIS